MAINHFSFIKAFGLGRRGVVCIVGAGGKTSLLFQLAAEARTLGFRTLVSTTTKMLIPDRDECDDIDLTGHGFVDKAPLNPGIYVTGKPVSSVKIMGLSEDVLIKNSPYFDLVLLEADGAAEKPLKGWLDTEPVIPAFTTHTIGVVDIQTIGKTISEKLVHRLDRFSLLTGAKPGDLVSVEHLKKIVIHREGLFFHASGKKIVYINKVESIENQRNSEMLMTLLSGQRVCTGSVSLKRIEAISNYL